jgi:hypothetical protein
VNEEPQGIPTSVSLLTDSEAQTSLGKRRRGSDEDEDGESVQDGASRLKS